MNIKLIALHVITRQTVETIPFSRDVNFIYGPVGKGKSTVARLIDYCFGGNLERTPAIQSEFVSVTLEMELGTKKCIFERSAEEVGSVRVSWQDELDGLYTVNAPLNAAGNPIVGDNVFNLSDLIFFLCNIEPIKVLKSRLDPESQLIRLSFRDVWRFCYLDQAHLDSSFFRVEDPIRGRKSHDALRFFTGLNSEALSILEADLFRARTDERSTAEAISRIEEFLGKFQFGSEMEIRSQIDEAQSQLTSSRSQLRTLEGNRFIALHPTDDLREKLRSQGKFIADLKESQLVAENALAEQESLFAELMTAKIKATRAQEAGKILSGVEFDSCPQCGSDVSQRESIIDICRLCGSNTEQAHSIPDSNFETLRLELNDRLDQLSDSISRRKQSIERTQRELELAIGNKEISDRRLQEELRQYDSAFIESVREVERNIATFQERIRLLNMLVEMPLQIDQLHDNIEEIRVLIMSLVEKIEAERFRLSKADVVVREIAEKFKRVMLNVKFPGVEDEDDIVLDPKNWRPTVVHGSQEWGFWDTGSGGKKTLFNVCFAMALQEVARERSLPVPNLLIVDSPTKNISEHMNPELVSALYDEIYEFTERRVGDGIQLLLIDSDIVNPIDKSFEFYSRRMAGTVEFPSLISYYDGP